ncbi:CpsD/CapB family tyrosine-protein kinase [Chloroflexi bacterium TSY]|nr:CpsD/CapB family tyrosine-protein kinase [Chloroflexi bacterium TSY]
MSIYQKCKPNFEPPQDDVTKFFNLPTLGNIPLIPEEEAKRSGMVIMQQGAPSASAEAYRVLRTNLQFAAVDTNLATLLITSPAPGDGKSVTAANIAMALAGIGRSVILIDADLHRPQQHRLFSLINNVGVTTALLTEQWNFDLLLRKTSVDGLRILTSGPLPPNPAELLGSDRMNMLLTNLKNEADIIVMDSPPATILSDTTILSTKSDAVLMVIRSGKTRRDQTKRALSSLGQVNSNLAGVVVNGIPAKRNVPRYGYGYHYDQGYNYTQVTSSGSITGRPTHSTRDSKELKPSKGGLYSLLQNGQPTNGQPNGGQQSNGANQRRTTQMLQNGSGKPRIKTKR